MTGIHGSRKASTIARALPKSLTVRTPLCNARPTVAFFGFSTFATSAAFGVGVRVKVIVARLVRDSSTRFWPSSESRSVSRRESSDSSDASSPTVPALSRNSRARSTLRSADVMRLSRSTNWAVTSSACEVWLCTLPSSPSEVSNVFTLPGGTLNTIVDVGCSATRFVCCENTSPPTPSASDVAFTDDELTSVTCTSRFTVTMTLRSTPCGAATPPVATPAGGAAVVAAAAAVDGAPTALAAWSDENPPDSASDPAFAAAAAADVADAANLVDPVADDLLELPQPTRASTATVTGARWARRERVVMAIGRHDHPIRFPGSMTIACPSGDVTGRVGWAHNPRERPTISFMISVVPP